MEVHIRAWCNSLALKVYFRVSSALFGAAQVDHSEAARCKVGDDLVRVGFILGFDQHFQSRAFRMTSSTEPLVMHLHDVATGGADATGDTRKKPGAVFHFNRERNQPRFMHQLS